MRRTKPARPADRADRILLLANAIWLVGLGAYFALFRPPLLPEDVRFIGLSAANTALSSLQLGQRGSALSSLSSEASSPRPVRPEWGSWPSSIF